MGVVMVLFLIAQAAAGPAGILGLPAAVAVAVPGEEVEEV
jgi:hypothetical protein